VMEGATLGGRMITRHVQATLGIALDTGGSFFEGYGANTATMWQTMRQLLVSGAPDVQSENTMVANAIATFACLRRWCESGRKPATTETTRHA
jgi:heme oxygenase (biliverdin-IX-beta and delta-forming)